MMGSRWRVFSFFFLSFGSPLASFLLCYLPVTQVELTRCIVGRLCEHMPKFLRLWNDHDGLALKFGPVVGGLVQAPGFLHISHVRSPDFSKL